VRSRHWWWAAPAAGGGQAAKRGRSRVSPPGGAPAIRTPRCRRCPLGARLRRRPIGRQNRAAARARRQRERTAATRAAVSRIPIQRARCGTSMAACEGNKIPDLGNVIVSAVLCCQELLCVQKFVFLWVWKAFGARFANRCGLVLSGLRALRHRAALVLVQLVCGTRNDLVGEALLRPRRIFPCSCSTQTRNGTF
jgi:hypothetical protein